MHPTLRRFRDPAGDVPADSEDAHELARSLQPTAPAPRALTNAALRDLQARVGPQYAASAAQLQLFQQQQQQQQQRAATASSSHSSSAFFPRASDSDPTWDGVFFAGGDADGGSLNAQLLPSSAPKHRRAPLGMQEQHAERERRMQQQQQFQLQQQQLLLQQQQQQHQQQQQQQQQQVIDDPESERDRMFRMRAMFLQQQHLMERQKHEQRQRMQLSLQQQQQQQQQVLAALPPQKPNYDDLPRRIHRELQPAVAPTPAPAPRANAPAPPAATASSLNLPLPPPLPSTARRFAGSGAPPTGSSAVGSEQLSSLEASAHALVEPVTGKQLLRKGIAKASVDDDINNDPKVYFRGAQQPGSQLFPIATDGRQHGGEEGSESGDDAVGEDSDDHASENESSAAARRNGSGKRKAPAKAKPVPAEPKRRCGRKSMNYSSEEKRERNRAAVKKCRQRQALKYDYLLQKAEVLATENSTLSDMLLNNVELAEEKRVSLTRGIQMDILLKIKEIFTQSLPKDFVLDADSIWDLNSVLAVSMPSRCYYGIESIKEFWRTSLRMRNKGKIRSFWAWLFRLPPGDRFTEFDIVPFSEVSNLYFVTWTTKSEPPLSGSMVIMFGHGHRVTLHVECFGWLIWRYLLSNEPFPEPNE